MPRTELQSGQSKLVSFSFQKSFQKKKSQNHLSISSSMLRFEKQTGSSPYVPISLESFPLLTSSNSSGRRKHLLQEREREREMVDCTVALSLVLRKLREADLSGSSELMSLRDCLRSAVGTLDHLWFPSPKFIWRDESSQLLSLIEDVNELAYKVEDMIDDILLEVHRKRMLRAGSFIDKRLRLFTRYALNPSLSPISGRKARKEIRGIAVMAERIRQISVEPCDMSSDDEPITPPSPLRLPDRLDKHVSSIGDVLMKGTGHVCPISVVAVVGMAGIGKTTLARRFFDTAGRLLKLDDNAVGVWLSLRGSSSSSTPLLTGTLKFIEEYGHGDHQLEEAAEERLVGYDIVERVWEVLQRRSCYVFVIDDMRRTGQWKQLDRALPIPVSMQHRSFVLITTRSMDVAGHVHPKFCPPYHLPLLNNDESWEFLDLTLALEDSDPDHLPLQNNIGDSDPYSQAQTLIDRCGGLPLALNEVAEQLEMAMGADTNQVLKEIRLMNEKPLNCLYVLATAYGKLPNNFIRSCFLYLCSFPVGTKMEASKLIRLWVAEGFIPAAQYFNMADGVIPAAHFNMADREEFIPAGPFMEDTAWNFLDVLISSSMIQAVQTDLRGRVATCVIHPAFYDLCFWEAKHNRFLNVIDGFIDTYYHASRRSLWIPRRLALHNLRGPSRIPPRNLFVDRERVRLQVIEFNDIDITNLRSLLSTKSALHLHNISGKFLTVVDLVGVETLAELPKHIGDLISLRYLGIQGCSRLTELPSSVGNLPLLQTLDVRKTAIQELPSTLAGTTTLRHLLAPEADIPLYDISGLTALQTLQVSNRRYSLRYLKLPSNIRALALKDLLGYSAMATMGLQQQLSSHPFQLLEKLESLRHKSKEPIGVLHVLGNLPRLKEVYLNGPITPLGHLASNGFPECLTMLTLDGSKLNEDPMLILGRLPNLRHLTLKNDAYLGKVMACFSLAFPALNSLQIWCLRGLQVWEVKKSTLPKLTSLTIGMCESLLKIPEGLHRVRSLLELEVVDPRGGFLDRIRAGGPDREIIKHVPLIKLNSIS